MSTQNEFGYAESASLLQAAFMEMVRGMGDIKVACMREVNELEGRKVQLESEFDEAERELEKVEGGSVAAELLGFRRWRLGSLLEGVGEERHSILRRHSVALVDLNIAFWQQVRGEVGDGVKVKRVLPNDIESGVELSNGYRFTVAEGSAVL